MTETHTTKLLFKSNEIGKIASLQSNPTICPRADSRQYRTVIHPYCAKRGEQIKTEQSTFSNTHSICSWIESVHVLFESSSSHLHSLLPNFTNTQLSPYLMFFCFCFVFSLSTKAAVYRLHSSCWWLKRDLGTLHAGCGSPSLGWFLRDWELNALCMRALTAPTFHPLTPAREKGCAQWRISYLVCLSKVLNLDIADKNYCTTKSNNNSTQSPATTDKKSMPKRLNENAFLHWHRKMAWMTFLIWHKPIPETCCHCSKIAFSESAPIFHKSLFPIHPLQKSIMVYGIIVFTQFFGH